MRFEKSLKFILTALSVVGLLETNRPDSSRLEGAEIASEVAPFVAELCRDGGGDWTRGVEFFVENRSQDDWSERIVEIPIAGTPEKPVVGALPLVGERAESLRFCDSSGVEFVFNVVDANGVPVEKGVLGEGGAATIPASIASGETARYFFFFRNDRAFPLPDRLERFRKRLSNLDFEQGTDGAPDDWIFDDADAGSSLVWSNDRPFSGERCVRCDVASNLKPSWIAARQRNVAVEPGEKYRFEGRVRGENVRGLVGFYLHFGNEGNEMISAPTVGFSDKTDFDWTAVSGEFVVPTDANLLSFGTVLYGTGTAWFDAVSIVREESADDAARSNCVRIGATFEIPVPASVYPSAVSTETRGSSTFDAKKIGLAADARFALVRIDASNAESVDASRLVRLDLKTLETRWGRTLNDGDFSVLDLRAQPRELFYFDGSAFFAVDVVRGARNYFVVVENNAPQNERESNVNSNKRAPQNVANQAFPGTTLQSTNAENADESDSASAKGVAESLALPEFLAARNLVRDGDCENFDVATGLPPTSENVENSRWARDADELDVEYSVVEPGVAALGKKAIQMKIGPAAELKWRGWRRRVSVEPNRTYCFGFAISTLADEGSFDLHLHQRRADGTLANGGMSSLGKPIGGNSAWTLKCGSFRTSSDADFVEFHLTSQTRGTVRYDSLFVAPVEVATSTAFLGGKSGVFQVPTVAKVFRDSTFNAEEREIAPENPAFCALALGEEETLQFAIRSETDRFVRLSASRPNLTTQYRSILLETPEIFAVGNVVVDYPSSYYNTQGSETQRKFPNGAPSTDGWIGYWPDPLIPIRNLAANNAETLEKTAPNPVDRTLLNDSQILAADGVDGGLRLKAGETRAVWLRFKTTSQTPPGLYVGALTLRDELGNERVLPYSLEVLAFQAPQTKVAAIYDARIARDYFGEGTRSQKLEKIAEKLLERKLSPDAPTAAPKFSFDKTTGTATADWTEYDRAAERYFDKLGGKIAYYPNEFYLFGWGNPPKNVEGEAPYEGEYPYDNADRAVLRSEYKKAYQAKLKLFWEHLKEKGWADKAVLYISDEPFYSKPEIIVQMKALCEMIHEVDPNIQIYCSTWVFVPEWLDYLDVWGVGHYGGVDEAALKRIKEAGGRIWWTTDGQMCLDTPLCATERLLPYTCVARGAEVYEFWGAAWFTCNPFDSASHLYISQSDQPGVQYYVRYPNGDGYIFYPGDLVGLKGEILDSIRSEQAREGIEDAGWLVGLQRAIAEKTASDSPERAVAQSILDRALDYLPLECGSGRFSSRYMSDPKEFEEIRLDVGRELQKLSIGASGR